MRTTARVWGLAMTWLAVVPAVFGANVVPSASPAPIAGPDIRAIVPPQPYFLKGSVLWLAVAAVSLLLAGLVAWYLLRRPRAPRPAGPRISPRDLARQRLAALAARADGLDARTFGGEVCDVLRVYVADEYKLQPQRQTSPEFLSTVHAARAASAGASGGRQRRTPLAAARMNWQDLTNFSFAQPAWLWLLAAPALLAFRLGRTGGAPAVVSEAVWCSSSAFSSAPNSTMMVEYQIQVMKPTTAPSEP